MTEMLLHARQTWLIWNPNMRKLNVVFEELNDFLKLCSERKNTVDLDTYTMRVGMTTEKQTLLHILKKKIG